MRVWRLTRKAHAQQPLSGEGAQRYGGRWNHVGVAVVYTSQSLSLAVLEYLVNLSISDLPDDLVSIQIEIPNNLPRAEITIKELPGNWRTYPSNEALKDIGSDWVSKATAALLIVPSVVIPSELNYLINPSHPLSAEISIVSVDAFSLDPRLYSTRKRAGKGSRRATP